MYLMELELYRRKEFVLSKTEYLQNRMKEMQENQLQLQSNLMAVQTCFGTVVRKMGEIHRFYESKLKLFEGKLDHHLNMGKATYKDAKAKIELLSHNIRGITHNVMLNKLQLETLTRDIYNHYKPHQTADITQSFLNSCSIVDDDEEVDKKITETVRDIEQRRTTSRQCKQMKRLIRHNRKL